VAVVVVDGENVRRSRWPNLGRDALEERVRAWAAREGHEARVVWEPADDRIAALASELAAAGEAFWVVTSDRGLRARIDGAERLVGGGAFLGTLQAGL
jgi:hypothetical protein